MRRQGCRLGQRREGRRPTPIPLALLPGSALVVANLDAHAMYASASAGAPLASFADSLVPLGADAGFVASRDVDRLVPSAYAANEADVAVVLIGRFDVDKIAAATRRRPARHCQGTYAGFATNTAGAITVAPADARTLVAGTNERVHRVLDRIQQGKLERSMPPWVGADAREPGRAVCGRRGLLDAAHRVGEHRFAQSRVAQGHAGRSHHRRLRFSRA